uniref:TIR domain-containing protein n=1 Tax=Anopheles coluzzii TaxID=1518534 RepID=A0A8W7PW05_ANOCL
MFIYKMLSFKAFQFVENHSYIVFIFRFLQTFIISSAFSSSSMAHDDSLYYLILLFLLTSNACGNDCIVSNPSSVQSKIECFHFDIYTDLMRVTCSNRPDYKLLQHTPKLERFTFKELIYQNCSLPIGNQSLVELLSAFLDRTQLSYTSKMSLIDNTKHSKNITLDPQLFAGLQKLHTLVIQNLADISFDNPLLFRHLSKLKKLHFYGRNRVSGKFVYQLRQLSHLYIQNSDMEILPKELVSNLPKLETLYLDKNKLNHVSQFPTLPNLMYLNISSNQLVKLQEDVFSTLPKLKILDLSSNKLTRLATDLLSENNHLEVFKADNQKCSELVLETQLFAYLRFLKEVSLSNCKIIALPEGLFEDCFKLIKVDLSHNKLQSIPEDLFRDLKNLQELYLQNNVLTNPLPDTLLRDAINLCILHLEKNNIKSLNKLNLSHNRLTLHENSKTGFYSNRRINSTSWALFSHLNKIQYLDLSHNLIVNISDHFKKYWRNLKFLNLSHNFITHVSYTDFPFLSTKINLVNLESNKITHPDFDLSRIEPLHRLPNEIFLADNPLNCDCISSSLVTYLQAHLNASKSIPTKGTSMRSATRAVWTYSHKDEEFVTDQMLPRLESEELNFKICWHVRDFMPGEMIASQITKAVEDSRRTIIILSHNYLESVWGQMEFSTAYLQSLEDKRNRVIPIIYQDIGDIDQLDPELQAYLKTNTYVRWDDPWFWDKLHYAMPRKRHRKHEQPTCNISMSSLNKTN